jgi:hypothetical protein
MCVGSAIMDAVGNQGDRQLQSIHRGSERKSSHQQSGCAPADEPRKNDKKEKKTGDRPEQEREFDRVLMGIYR